MQSVHCSGENLFISRCEASYGFYGPFSRGAKAPYFPMCDPPPAIGALTPYPTHGIDSYQWTCAPGFHGPEDPPAPPPTPPPRGGQPIDYYGPKDFDAMMAGDRCVAGAYLVTGSYVNTSNVYEGSSSTAEFLFFRICHFKSVIVSVAKQGATNGAAMRYETGAIDDKAVLLGVFRGWTMSPTTIAGASTLKFAAAKYSDGDATCTSSANGMYSVQVEYACSNTGFGYIQSVSRDGTCSYRIVVAEKEACNNPMAYMPAIPAPDLSTIGVDWTDAMALANPLSSPPRTSAAAPSGPSTFLKAGSTCYTLSGTGQQVLPGTSNDASHTKPVQVEYTLCPFGRSSVRMNGGSTSSMLGYFHAWTKSQNADGVGYQYSGQIFLGGESCGANSETRVPGGQWKKLLVDYQCTNPDTPLLVSALISAASCSHRIVVSLPMVCYGMPSARRLHAGAAGDDVPADAAEAEPAPRRRLVSVAEAPVATDTNATATLDGEATPTLEAEAANVTVPFNSSAPSIYSTTSKPNATDDGTGGFTLEYVEELSDGATFHPVDMSVPYSEVEAAGVQYNLKAQVSAAADNTDLSSKQSVEVPVGEEDEDGGRKLHVLPADFNATEAGHMLDSVSSLVDFTSHHAAMAALVSLGSSRRDAVDGASEETVPGIAEACSAHGRDLASSLASRVKPSATSTATATATATRTPSGTPTVSLTATSVATASPSPFVAYSPSGPASYTKWAGTCFKGVQRVNPLNWWDWVICPFGAITQRDGNLNNPTTNLIGQFAGWTVSSVYAPGGAKRYYGKQLYVRGATCGGAGFDRSATVSFECSASPEVVIIVKEPSVCVYSVRLLSSGFCGIDMLLGHEDAPQVMSGPAPFTGPPILQQFASQELLYYPKIADDPIPSQFGLSSALARDTIIYKIKPFQGVFFQLPMQPSALTWFPIGYFSGWVQELLANPTTGNAAELIYRTSSYTGGMPCPGHDGTLYGATLRYICPIGIAGAVDGQIYGIAWTDACSLAISIASNVVCGINTFASTASSTGFANLPETKSPAGFSGPSLLRGFDQHCFVGKFAYDRSGMPTFYNSALGGPLAMQKKWYQTGKLHMGVSGDYEYIFRPFDRVDQWEAFGNRVKYDLGSTFRGWLSNNGYYTGMYFNGGTPCGAVPRRSNVWFSCGTPVIIGPVYESGCLYEVFVRTPDWCGVELRVGYETSDVLPVPLVDSYIAGTRDWRNTGPAVFRNRFAGSQIVGNYKINDMATTFDLRVFDRLDMINANGWTILGSFAGWLTDGQSYLGQWYDGGYTCPADASRKNRAFVWFACGPNVSVVNAFDQPGVACSPQIYLTSPDFCNIDMRIGKEAAPIATPPKPVFQSALPSLKYYGLPLRDWTLHGPVTLINRLKGQVWSGVADIYYYVIKPFEWVWQRTKVPGFQTKVGAYSGWALSSDGTQYAGMWFNNGDMCTRGVARRSHVYWTCGPVFQVTSVYSGTNINEPDWCYYRIDITLPEVCGVDLRLGYETAGIAEPVILSPAIENMSPTIARPNYGPFAIRHRMAGGLHMGAFNNMKINVYPFRYAEMVEVGGGNSGRTFSYG